MRFTTAWCTGMLCLTLASGHTHAFDSVSAEFAAGSHTEMLRIGIQRNWMQHWWQGGGRHLTGYWNLTLANWTASRYHGIPNRKENILDFGITPVFRYRPDKPDGWYAEFAIGLHLLSDYYDNDNRKLSTRFQFGDHVGVGYIFKNGLDTSIAIQHFSNGSIKRPNSGIDFIVLRLALPL